MIPVDSLTALCAKVFGRLGGSSDQARRIAVSLVGANLMGHDSCGVIRVHVTSTIARYLDWFKQAKAMPSQTILTPGEPEGAARAKRLTEGVPLSAETWESIADAARGVGLEDVRVDRTLAKI